MENFARNNMDHMMDSSELKKMIHRRWPESVGGVARSGSVLSTGISALDSLFEQRGIPHGQLVELTGETSSGKTSLLMQMISNFTRAGVVAYLDFSGTFFPSAAENAGSDLSRLLCVSPEGMKEGLRSAELILRARMACCIVFDLIGTRGRLPVTLLHRIRQRIQRSDAIVILLTEGNSGIIPESMISLGILTERLDSYRILVSIKKSRFSKVGEKVVIAL